MTRKSPAWKEKCSTSVGALALNRRCLRISSGRGPRSAYSLAKTVESIRVTPFQISAGRVITLGIVLAGILAPSHAQVDSEPLRPIRVMQEMPWAINTVTGVASGMEAVLGYWDQQTQMYFLDYLSLMSSLGYDAEVEGGSVSASTGEWEVVVDFDSGVANSENPSRSFELLPGGYLRNSEECSLERSQCPFSASSRICRVRLINADYTTV